MTVEAMSSLPFQAGGAVAAAAGRTALWAISLYMRQPLRNTAVVALVGLSAMAGSNALYHQAHHHPAPLFGSFAADDEPAPVRKKARSVVLPAERPRQFLEPISGETTGSVDEPARTPQTIGTDDVLAMQQKLIALGLLDGKADGLFGPHTARAIKSFEASIGRPQRGLLTLDILNRIRDAQMPPPPSAAPAALPQVSLPSVTAQTQAASLPAVAAPPATPAKTSPAALKPLPAPPPLLASATPTASPAVADDAGDPDADATTVAAIEPDDGSATGIETLPMTRQSSNVAKRAVSTIAVHAQPAAVPDQQMPDALAPATEGRDASTDPDVVASVQRGLNSLGFLHAPVDGVAGEATAKAIRNFEVYFNYDVTGRVTRELVKLLQQNGAAV